jgi:hypothetical protein
MDDVVAPQRKARLQHTRVGIVVSVVLSLLAYPLLTGAVQAPATTEALVADVSAPSASLIRRGDTVEITGSVAELFQTGSFAGPNRAQKSDRARLTPDGTTVSEGFKTAWARLTEQRQQPLGPAEPQAIQVASIDSSMGSTAVHPNGSPLATAADTVTQVASLDPAAALSAIDQIVPFNPAPVPMAVPSQLAYARENTDPPALDVDKYGHKVSERDQWCMATAIYFEARGESYRGQVAVGQVVMNRLANKLYPKDICGVVFQNQQMHNACQFSFACDGIPESVSEPKPWAQAQEIAKGVINGSLYLPEVDKATHYHANYVYPSWAPQLKKTATIGHHIFYKFKWA